MAEQNTADSSHTVEPAAKVRKQTTRNRTLRSMQDDVPHHAAARRDPRRASLALERSQFCARIADDNRAKDILVLDLREITPLVDYFVIVTAGTRRQGNAIASEIDAAMKKQGEAKLGLEGSEEGRWILIDYGDFVVHIFNPEYRVFYALEEIWGDAPQLDWQNNPPAEREPAGAESRPA
jgi:ribosome-associated protein